MFFASHKLGAGYHQNGVILGFTCYETRFNWHEIMSLYFVLHERISKGNVGYVADIVVSHTIPRQPALEVDPGQTFSHCRNRLIGIQAPNSTARVHLGYSVASSGQWHDERQMLLGNAQTP